MYETEDTLVITVELAGLTPEDIDLSVARNEVVVSGARQPLGEDTYHRMERRSGRFERHLSLTMPVDVDSAEAHYRHGVLTVVLPRRDSGSQAPRRLEVQE
jgi:HSP20 family protein